MTLIEAVKAIGKTAKFRTRDGLTMWVTIQDAGSEYGNVRVLISDEFGASVRVDASRVALAEVTA